ncbi:MAG: hypothetical protein AseanaTS_11250 [Candidatus Pelagadaptatus aseana]|uniref:response regulator n=1 Tax=Candidatus Pelagadaptatus aseana TaxID=3120508 RepID=UPI0039B2E404
MHKKILVVDDDFISRAKLPAILANIGDCHTHESGEEALAVFQHALEIGAPFDLIALDIEMPGMSGHAVLQNLRNIEDALCVPEHQRTKVIMVSVHDDPSNIISSLKTGADAYLIKPFDYGDMLDKLSEIGMAIDTGLLDTARLNEEGFLELLNRFIELGHRRLQEMEHNRSDDDYQAIEKACEELQITAASISAHIVNLSLIQLQKAAQQHPESLGLYIQKTQRELKRLERFTQTRN